MKPLSPTLSPEGERESSRRFPGGRGEDGACADVKFMGYGVSDIIGAMQHVVVRETDYSEDNLLDVVGALLIGHLPFVAMRIAVDLNHEAGRKTDEVDDVLT